MERARPLDRESLDKWMEKARSAEDFGDKREGKKRRKKREVLSQVAVHNIETRLRNAIRAEARNRMLKSQKGRPQTGTAEPVEAGPDLAEAPQEMEKAVIISTRALLPYYNLDNVNQFLDIFAKVDESFTGELDVHEWIKLFTSLNESIPVQEARMVPSLLP